MHKSEKDEMGKPKLMLDPVAQARIQRRKKKYMPFEIRKPRERCVCPRCDSLNVRRRHYTHDYICYNCGWSGKTIKKDLR